MRHVYLTASIIAVFGLIGCTDAPERETETGIATVEQSSSAPPSEHKQNEIAQINQPQISPKRLAETYETSIRRRFKGLESRYFSKEEIEEYIALEREKREVMAINREKYQAWKLQDPSVRGPAPQPQGDVERINYITNRLRVLNDKFRAAQSLKPLRKNLRRLSETSNFPLTDEKIDRLIELQSEKQQLEAEHQRATIEWSRNRSKTDGYIDNSNYPDPDRTRIHEIERQIKAIRGPLDAAAGAAKIRQEMLGLSAQYNIPILDNEIEELIALTAEKNRIDTRFQDDVYKPWIDGARKDGVPPPLMNRADYERVKVIEDRIKAIRRPLVEARQNEQEANKPSLKAARLRKELNEKRSREIKDQQQAGELPSGSPTVSPSYKEVEGFVRAFPSQLDARADKVGYNIPSSDLKRLEAFNQDLLDIRKEVFAMEKTGTTMVTNKDGSASPSFAMMSRMYQMGLVIGKQQDILEPLFAAEKAQGITIKHEVGVLSGARQNNKQPVPTAQEFIDNWIAVYKRFNREIPRSDIDRLLEFERALENR